MKRSLLALLISLALAIPALAVAGDAAEPVNAETVGGFAVKLAAALGATAGDQQAAATALRAAGADLRADLGARLTESEAARILSDLGMKVATPASPTNAVSPGMATQLATIAGLAVATPAVNVEGDDLPVECLSEKNHGQCVNCCKAAIGDLSGGNLTQLCLEFCINVQPPHPSKDDPEPLP